MFAAAYTPLLFAVVALLLLRTRLPMLSGRQSDGMMMVTLPAADAARLDEVMGFLQERLPHGGVDSVTEGDADVSIAYRFRRLDQAEVPTLHAALKELVGSARASVFFHQAGDV